jgi:hypothetical protein
MADDKPKVDAPDAQSGALPKESLESGAAASKFVDAPNKPDESSIMQEEILPGGEGSKKQD